MGHFKIDLALRILKPIWYYQEKYVFRCLGLFIYKGIYFYFGRIDPNNEFFDGEQDNDKDGFLDVWWMVDFIEDLEIKTLEPSRKWHQIIHVVVM